MARERTTERDGGERGDWSRRTVLKISGVGAGLAALGAGTAAGQEGEETPTSTPGAGTGDAVETNEVHVVRTLISGPPRNPQRPADFFYQPTGLHVQPGDVVKFRFVTPDHNVVSYHPAFGMRRRVPTGVDSFSAPIHGWTDDSIADDQVEPPTEMGGGGEGGGSGGDENGGGAMDGGENGPEDGGSSAPEPSTWLHAFETPGVYDLLCSPHEIYGMVMRVVVGDETDVPFEISDPENLAEPRAGPAGLARQVLTDPALRPSNIVDEGQVSWGSLEANQSAQTPTGGGGTPTEES